MYSKFLPFLFLFLGVPWFWMDKLDELFLGLPLWVIHAIVMSTLASISIAVLLTDRKKNE